MSAVIVGVDGSQHSQHALEWALAEGALRHVAVTVMTVSPVRNDWFSKPAGPDGQRWHAIAQEQVDKALSHPGNGPPPSVTVRATRGVPAEELMNAAEEGDMIVVAARGSGGFARLRLGSVGTQLTHHARCPVVIIPPDDMDR
jgi:nucleotide-binding universal stress UspA family protein